MRPPCDRRIVTALAASLLLGLMVGLAFWPVLGNGWVDWDDRENFVENTRFRGLSGASLVWAATTHHLGVYQPLSWVMYEVEYVVFGLQPRGYHALSLILHALNVGVLFVMVRALVARGRPDLVDAGSGRLNLGCFLATALFAVHPLRVEVVAWVSGQAYLPSAMCSMMAVLAYLRAHPEVGSSRRGWIVATWCLMLLAMLFKAAAVPVVAVLVVLDVYPLRRLGGKFARWFDRRSWRVWAEKVPFLALAWIFSAKALSARNRITGPVPDLPSDLARSAHALFFYLSKTVLPTRLCTNYFLAQDHDWYPWPGIPAIAGLAGMTLALAFAWTKPMRALVAAWVASLVLIAPTLGAIRLGNQYAADRYTYFATIPWVAILAGWITLGMRTTSRQVAVTVVTLAVVAGLGTLTWRQAETWASSEALARQVLASVEPPPPETLNALGRSKARRGEFADAEDHYLHALRLDPGFAPARVSLGLLRLDQNRVPEAIAEFEEAIRIDPLNAEPHNNLGAALGRIGRLDRAISEFRRALALNPNFAPAQANLRRAQAIR